MPNCNTLDSDPFVATILGEPASKSNSRRAVVINNTSRFIKSKKALEYSKGFLLQLRQRESLFEEDVVVAMKIFYRTKRPDLDESLVLDLMQGLVYKNDRQVKAKIIIWGIDKERPRVTVYVAPLIRTQDAFRFITSAS